MESAEIIISGPELTVPEKRGSVAEHLIPKMKAHPKDFIIQVDCATGEKITAREFLRQSLQTAEGLIKFGLKTEDVVVLICSNSTRGQVAAIGILLSGGIYAPIDHTVGNFELQHYLKEFKPKFIICESEKGKQVLSCIKAVDIDAKIILMDSTTPNGEFFCWEDIKTQVDVDKYVPRGVADSKKCICAIISSSGSTGMPKGVALSHFAVLSYLSIAECLTRCDITPNLLLTSPLFWISGTVMLLKSCYFLQTRYVPKSLSVEDVLEAIQNYKPMLLGMSPKSLLSIVLHENFKKYDVSSIRNLVSGGAALPRSTANTIKEMWKGITVSNIYGLTETTGGVILTSGNEDPCAMGKVNPGIKVKVVDITTGASLGPNETGEIRIKANTVMNGYYNNEEATEASFDEGGWLRTGDIVYYDEDEVFYFAGRLKEAIQYLGFRVCKAPEITPSELESFLIGLTGVKDVAVVGVPHETDVNHVRALVVKDPKSNITAEYIVQQVKENLADRKQLRGGVQFVDSLPRTNVGKLKRRELPKLIQI